MEKYCGFIEVWTGRSGLHELRLPKPYFFLEHDLGGTSSTPGCKTIAIFKIKLK